MAGGKRKAGLRDTPAAGNAKSSPHALLLPKAMRPTEVAGEHVSPAAEHAQHVKPAPGKMASTTHRDKIRTAAAKSTAYDFSETEEGGEQGVGGLGSLARKVIGLAGAAHVDSAGGSKQATLKLIKVCSTENNAQPIGWCFSCVGFYSWCMQPAACTCPSMAKRALVELQQLSDVLEATPHQDKPEDVLGSQGGALCNGLLRIGTAAGADKASLLVDANSCFTPAWRGLSSNARTSSWQSARKHASVCRWPM
jgi:hypothetical protein